MDPRTFHLECDADGWFIADDFYDEVTPTRRWQWKGDAEEALSLMVSAWLEYDGEDDHDRAHTCA